MNTDDSKVEDINIPQLQERLSMSCIASFEWPNIFRNRSFTLCKNDRDFSEKFYSVAVSESMSSSSMTNLSASWVNCCPPTGLTVLDYWVFGFGWIRWVLIQLFLKENRWRWSRWRIYFLVYDFSRFHHNHFRDTTSWECIVKDDCITSCLIELQSFTLSKLYSDPMHRVLVSFPLLLLVPCKTWFGQVKLVRIFVFLVHGIHSRKEYCLSFPAWVLSSRYQSWICDGGYIDRTSNMINVLEEIVWN